MGQIVVYTDGCLLSVQVLVFNYQYKCIINADFLRMPLLKDVIDELNCKDLKMG